MSIAHFLNQVHKAMISKVLQKKHESIFGNLWDANQIFLSIFSCATYIAESYVDGYHSMRFFLLFDEVTTQFFMIDLLFNWFIAHSWRNFFLSSRTIVDILTIFPIYFNMIVQSSSLSVIRFVRILRLMRVLRIFRMLGGLSGINRQIIVLCLSLFCLCFIAAGIFSVVENDLAQLQYDCKYINAYTNYEPSCRSDRPNDDVDCDCSIHSCTAKYDIGDTIGIPTLIKCTNISFFLCIYFVVVTMATVGYGDITATSNYGRLVVIVFIVSFLVIIPMQVNQLTTILSAASIYRRSYVPTPNEEHVIICGYVNNRRKLERFLTEFFHPDRVLTGSVSSYNIVILCNQEPIEEVRSLLLSPKFDSRVTYIVGTALSVDDLYRVRADVACSIFFLCNAEAKGQRVSEEGSAVVLQTLSIIDYNPSIRCLVEVMKKEDSGIMVNTDIDVVICIEDFNSMFIGRSAVCPGLCSLLGNLMHTYSGGSDDEGIKVSPWMIEYECGLGIDTYYIFLDPNFVKACNCEWTVICEIIYVQFNCILLGLVDIETGVLNVNPYATTVRMNGIFSGVLLAPDQETASYVSIKISDPVFVESLLQQVSAEESRFAVRACIQNEAIRQIKNDLQRILIQARYLRSEIVTKEKARANISTVPEELYNSIQFKSPLNEKRHISEWSSIFSGHGRARKLMDGQISNASMLHNHIVIIGNANKLECVIKYIFINNQLGEGNVNVLYINEEMIENWNTLHKAYPHLYFLELDVATNPEAFQLANIVNASSVIFLSSEREELEFENVENADFENLFLFLQIYPQLPEKTHYIVELTSSRNMTVINSVAVRQKLKGSYSTRHEGANEFEYVDEVAGSKVLLDPTVSKRYYYRKGLFSSQYVTSVDQITSRKEQVQRKSRSTTRVRSLSFLEEVKNRKPENQVNSSTADVSSSEYYKLPIYASGRAFVADTVENLLCQVIKIL